MIFLLQTIISVALLLESRTNSELNKRNHHATLTNLRQMYTRLLRKQNFPLPDEVWNRMLLDAQNK